MLWTILGLAVAALMSVAGVFATARWSKATVMVLAAAGLAVGSVSAMRQEEDAKEAREAASRAKADLERANTQLDSLNATLAVVHASVGDLAALGRLAGGNRYYVRLATGHTHEELEKLLAALSNQFKGAKSSGMVAIREHKGARPEYELVFGQNLDFVAAEVFQRLAMSHHLANGVASIHPEASE
jgi:hypothetical protein